MGDNNMFRTAGALISRTLLRSSEAPATDVRDIADAIEHRLDQALNAADARCACGAQAGRASRHKCDRCFSEGIW
jgi:hypothetical protein